MSWDQIQKSLMSFAVSTVLIVPFTDVSVAMNSDDEFISEPVLRKKKRSRPKQDGTLFQLHPLDSSSVRPSLKKGRNPSVPWQLTKIATPLKNFVLSLGIYNTGLPEDYQKNPLYIELMRAIKEVVGPHFEIRHLTFVHRVYITRSELKILEQERVSIDQDLTPPDIPTVPHKILLKRRATSPTPLMPSLLPEKIETDSVEQQKSPKIDHRLSIERLVELQGLMQLADLASQRIMVIKPISSKRTTITKH